MWKWIRDHCTPHEGNEYRPHLLRPKSALLVAALVLILEVGFLLQASFSGPFQEFFALVLPTVLVDQTNDARIAENVNALRVSPILERAAMAKANDMAKKGYFAHTSPEGITPWYWFKDAGYVYSYAGENLAVNFVDSRDVTNAWLESPKHKANIINGKYTEIGIATAEGLYEGRPAVLVVQLFGKPSTKQPIVKNTVPISTPRATAVTPPDTTVAVKGVEIEEPSVEIAGSTVTANPTYASISQLIFANPKQALGVIFLVLAGIILATLFISLALNVHTKHPALAANGVLLVVFLLGVFIASDYITLVGANIRAGMTL